LKSIKLSGDSFSETIDDNKIKNLLPDIELNYICDMNKNNIVNKVDYINSYFTLGYINDNGLEFHTFSDLISSSIASYDVLTFYLTFILVIGNFLRNGISGEAERVVLTEMPEPQDIMNLCEGIKLYRYKYDFEK